MNQILDIFFYINYNITFKLFKNKEYPVFSSIVVITFYQVFTLLFILDFILFQILDRRDVVLERSEILGFIIITIILIFNYFYFHKKERYKKIINKYNEVNKQKVNLYYTISIVYMIFIILLNIYSVYSIKNNIHWW